ncbi:hypothetical protein EVAR_52281_1 [Eumeta japonica]|uniref:Uncharacterized protein n=1 Tax=Eumeta variegata TaxID=151549 RepID=A0A4C1YVV8_EUMVA|nr:hypothetical protein EVAR_52281_1 [Eumeta japonica]
MSYGPLPKWRQGRSFILRTGALLTAGRSHLCEGCHYSCPTWAQTQHPDRSNRPPLSPALISQTGVRQAVPHRSVFTRTTSPSRPLCTCPFLVAIYPFACYCCVILPEIIGLGEGNERLSGAVRTRGALTAVRLIDQLIAR